MKELVRPIFVGSASPRLSITPRGCLCTAVDAADRGGYDHGSDN